MALNTDVVCMYEIEPRGIHDIRWHGLVNVLAARSMALFASCVPLRYRVRLDVVIDRVATVACWAGGSFHVIRWVIRHPPVGPVLDKISSPEFMIYVPLCPEREIVIDQRS